LKRYYECPVKKYVVNGKDIWRAKITEYGYSYLAEIPTGEDGKPKYDWTIIHVESDDWTDLENDPDFVFIADNPGLDDSVRVPNALRGRMASRGVVLRGRMKKRDLVSAVGKRLSEKFNVDDFKVAPWR